MEDPDAPDATFTPWLLWNIDPGTAYLDDQSIDTVSGKNGTGETGYRGPCPPSGSHRYYFQVYAQDNVLDLEEEAEKSELKLAMETHIIGEGKLMGRYQGRYQKQGQ